MTQSVTGFNSKKAGESLFREIIFPRVRPNEKSHIIGHDHFFRFFFLQTPIGLRSHSIISPDDDYEKLAALPAQGIFCNWCHNISEVKHLGDAGYELEPERRKDDPSTMLGPFKDAYSDYHPTKYSELHTRSEFRGLCHNVSHASNKLPLEATYDKWKNSPYNTGIPETLFIVRTAT